VSDLPGEPRPQEPGAVHAWVGEQREPAVVERGVPVRQRGSEQRDGDGQPGGPPPAPARHLGAATQGHGGRQQEQRVGVLLGDVEGEKAAADREAGDEVGSPAPGEQDRDEDHPGAHGQAETARDEGQIGDGPGVPGRVGGEEVAQEPGGRLVGGHGEARTIGRQVVPGRGRERAPAVRPGKPDRERG
jgi:hypothetical protein